MQTTLLPINVIMPVLLSRVLKDTNITPSLYITCPYIMLQHLDYVVPGQYRGGHGAGVCSGVGNSAVHWPIHYTYQYISTLQLSLR